MNIFVSNISWTARENELQELFEQYGTVDSVRIIKDKHSGRSKGYGFVEMPDNEQAQKAISSLHQADLKGRQLNVSEARPSEGGRDNRY